METTDHPEHPHTRSRRAVSPVIGVILMVAITVILAAVIGAFVLEIGDQQETAPSTSFDSEEAVKIYKDEAINMGPDRNTNLTTVSVTHAGGDVLDVSQTRFSVNGNTSTYGPGGNYDRYEKVSSYPGREHLHPQPKAWKALGSNEEVPITSGETFDVIGFGAISFETARKDAKANSNVYFHGSGQWIIRGDDADSYYCDQNDVGYYDGDGPGSDDGSDDRNTLPGMFSGDTGSTGSYACIDDIDQGDEFQVVWEASSGGKTQTLFKYTAQQSNEN